MNNLFLFMLLCIGVLQARAATADVIKDTEVQAFYKGDYDGSKPPGDSTTNVSLGIYVNHMSLDQDKQELKIHLYLRQRWKDERFDSLASKISGDNIRSSLHGAAIDLAWKPDTFVRNALEIKSPRALTDQRLFRLSDESVIWFVQTIDMVVSCYSRFGEKQLQCPIMFESFSYTMDTIEFHPLAAPVDLDPSIYIPSIAIEESVTADCSQNYTAGSFPCFEIRFFFSRDLTSPYTNGLYVLTFILVLVSWAGFWIDGDLMFRRCGLGLVVVLALGLSNISVLISSTLRHSERVQIWTTFCTTFAALTLVEYLVVHVALRIIPQRISTIRSGAVNKDAEPSPSKADKIAKILDVVFGLIVFPVIFLLFIIFFWAGTSYA